MTRDQYRRIVIDQKKQRRPCTKIIHLLINFRSRCPERYPYGMVQVLKWAKDTTRNLNDVLPEFYNMEGCGYSQPLFQMFKFQTRNVKKESKCRVAENPLPF